MSTTETQTYNIAVCLFNGVTTLDYLGPMELFGFLTETARRIVPITDSVLLNITYLGPGETPTAVEPSSGPIAMPNLTYTQAMKAGRQFDILFVPGGMCFALFVFSPSDWD